MDNRRDTVAAAAHGMFAGNGHHGPDQHAARHALLLNGDIQTMVLTCSVDVREPGRTEQYSGAPRPASEGVGRRVARGQIRFGFDDPPAGVSVHEPCAQQGRCHFAWVALEETPSKWPAHRSGEICTLMEPVALSSAVSNARLTSPKANLCVTTGSSVPASSASNAVVIAKSLSAPSKA